MSFVIESTTPVGTIARFLPEAIGVFESLDIDFGCYGNRSLADAAAAAGADLDDALAMLAAGRSGDDQTEISLPDLIHRITTEHHRFDRELMRDLVRRLGPRNQRDGEVARIGRIRTGFPPGASPAGCSTSSSSTPWRTSGCRRSERLRCASARSDSPTLSCSMTSTTLIAWPTGTSISRTTSSPRG